MNGFRLPVPPGRMIRLGPGSPCPFCTPGMMVVMPDPRPAVARRALTGDMIAEGRRPMLVCDRCGSK